MGGPEIKAVVPQSTTPRYQLPLRQRLEEVIGGWLSHATTRGLCEIFPVEIQLDQRAIRAFEDRIARGLPSPYSAWMEGRMAVWLRPCLKEHGWPEDGIYVRDMTLMTVPDLSAPGSPSYAGDERLVRSGIKRARRPADLPKEFKSRISDLSVGRLLEVLEKKCSERALNSLQTALFYAMTCRDLDSRYPYSMANMPAMTEEIKERTALRITGDRTPSQR